MTVMPGWAGSSPVAIAAEAYPGANGVIEDVVTREMSAIVL
jgi:hypothetical protein